MGSQFEVIDAAKVFSEEHTTTNDNCDLTTQQRRQNESLQLVKGFSFTNYASDRSLISKILKELK